MPRLLSLLRNVFRHDRVERDLDEEMRATLDALVAEKMRAGMDRSTARRAAAMDLGIESIKTQVRDVRAGASLEWFARDLRHAARLLWRNPLFTLTAAISLAVGVGANTAVFTVAEGLLRFAPAAVIEPDRLVEIGRRFEGIPFGFNPASYPDYLDIRRRTSTLDHVYAHTLFPQTLTLTGDDGPANVAGEIITTNYFAALGTSAAIGRVFNPDESDRPGATSVVVLSHRLWMRRFDGDRAIVGKTLRLNRYPVTVIGVAPEGFQGTSILAADLWAPLSLATVITPLTQTQLETRRAGWLVMGARLKAGASLTQAEQELNAIDRALREEFPRDEENLRALRVQSASPVAGNGPVAAAAVVLLGGITATVLIIACANVAGLLLARAAARRREMALRLAIGAGRGRLIRQLLTETLLLFVVGAVMGVGLARLMSFGVLSIVPTLPIPVQISTALDWRAFAFGVGLSLVAALLSGLAPALHASRADVATVLKDEAQGSRLRLRSAFVVAQVALSVMLIVVGGLFIRALQGTGAGDAGFDAHDVEVASIDLSAGGYTNESGPNFARDLLDDIRALPMVQSASLSLRLPLATETMGVGLSLPGFVPQPGAPPDVFGSGNIVEPGYFAALKIPLIEGRDFNAQDANGAPLVAIVGETAARRFWPRQSPIGERLVVSGGTLTGAQVQVVGVARDLQYSSLFSRQVPFVYLPWRQNYAPAITLVVRTRGEAAASRTRALVASKNASLSSLAVRPLEEAIAVGLLPQRLVAIVAGGLGAIGIWLAALGMYGVTAYTIARRTREIAIRSALGAPRRAVILLALKHAMSLAGIGSLVGLPLALVVGQVLSALLLGVSPIDPLTLLAAIGLCALVVLAACYVPVHRAVRIPAADALRVE